MTQKLISEPQISCRSIRAGDEAQVAAIFIELQDFHHLPVQEKEMIERQIRTKSPAFEIIVADNAGEICGFALASVYPGPGIAPGLYLKELFVTEATRKHGVGKLLMKSLAELALSRGYQRIDWVTTKDNAKAQAFYEHLGATLNTEKIFYRLDEKAMRLLISVRN